MTTTETARYQVGGGGGFHVMFTDETRLKYVPPEGLSRLLCSISHL